MICFIMNPQSGTTSENQKKQIIASIERIPEAKIFYTQAPAHATQLAQEAATQGFGRVVAVGGDGTVNEVARGLLYSETALGIVPVGSGNGLARHLRIPLVPNDAIRFATEAKTSKIDACFLNDIPFFCTAGLGFDAAVAHRFARQSSRGLSTYVKTTFREFLSYKPIDYQIEIAGEKTVYKAFGITFANASQFGNDALIAPQADIADGFFEFCKIAPLSFLGGGEMTFRLFRGTLPQAKSYQSQRLSHVKLTGLDEWILHYDGEPLILKTDELSVSIVPQALKVIA
jgi:diacylglycerol kinase (ATP)